MELFTQIGATAGPVILAFMGLYVSVRPPKAERRVHWFWFISFAVVGLLASGASFMEIHSTDAALDQSASDQKSIKDQLNGLKTSIDTLALNRNTPSGSAGLISDDDAQKLIATLKPLVVPDVNVVFMCPASAAQPCRAAAQWLKIFREAGWKTSELTYGIFMPPVEGILIQVKSDDTKGAGIIQKALSSVGLTAPGQIRADLPDNSITVIFGS